MNFLKKLFQANYFVSDAEKFLQEFDVKNSKKSASQLKEIAKYKRINYLRDHAIKAGERNKIWEGF